MGLNDDAWEKIFKKYHILDELRSKGQFIISAKQIREFREPRLMTKFDHKINLPTIFSENQLAILPISRGDYIISSFFAYEQFENVFTKFHRISIPPNIQSLMPQFIISEAIALNCAHACGVLNDFLEEDELIATVSGRMGSGTFNFNIDSAFGIRNVIVSNSQIEIDAAYEGRNCLALIEAKSDLSEDFLVRQLYYPFRTWNTKVTKPIKSIFLTFSNGIFNLYQYQFESPNNYNSLHLVKHKKYIIETAINLKDIEHLLIRVPEISEPPIAFPQANDMLRIINLIELLNEKPLTREIITSEYAFDIRQTNYYTDAGRYLGLIEKVKDNNNIIFYLSEKGQYIMNLPYRERQLALVSRILEHRPFREILKIYFKSGMMPDKKTIVQIMKKSNVYNIHSENTFFRRSSTITSWINWILSLVDDR